jgi:diguanylate cyclase (GGDEF)-like protein/PAS domain S-box-containing protein
LTTPVCESGVERRWGNCDKRPTVGFRLQAGRIEVDTSLVKRARAAGEFGSRLALFGVYTSVPLAIVAFYWLRQLGLLSSTPYWIVVALLTGTAVANLLANTWLARRPESLVRLHGRVAVSALSTAAVLHSTGWGSILAIGYALGAAELLGIAGARTWRPALAWNIFAIALGELAVALELAPTMLEPRLAHFASAMGALCLVLVGRILGTTAETAERAELEVRESEEHFRELVQHATDVIAVIDADGTLRYVSPAIKGLLGYEPDECVDRHVDMLLSTETAARALDLFASASTTPGRPVMFDTSFVHRSGEERLVEATVTGKMNATGPGVVANLHDMTEQRLLEEQLIWDAGHDALTGLWNRAALTANLTQACERGARDGSRIALLFVDLDGFKAVNDTLGHEVGDAALVETAHRLRAAVRSCDTVARLGGDEFTILLDQLDDESEVLDVADRVVAAFDATWPQLGEHLRLTASVGIALSDATRTTAAELLRLADAAMYEAKRSGRSCWARDATI